MLSKSEGRRRRSDRESQRTREQTDMHCVILGAHAPGTTRRHAGRPAHRHDTQESDQWTENRLWTPENMVHRHLQ